MTRPTNRKSLWATIPILVLAATLVRPIWGAPADVLDSPAPIPGDPAPKTRNIGAGDATVATQTGALEYGFPISVPPGRGSATPSLSLQYSSRGAIYGNVAQGWSIPIPEISWDKSAGDLGNRWVSSMAGGKPLIPVNEAAPNYDTEATFRARHDASYARYQKMDSAQDAAWRVLTPDGMTYFFGERSRLENDGDVGTIDAPLHWFPLTRSVDPFGNTVEYIWHVDPHPGDPNAEAGRRTIYLDRIEYSSNPSQGVDAHARIKFNVDPPVFRAGSSFPQGASQEVLDPDPDNKNFDHEFWYRGAHPIASIDTEVKDDYSSQSWRTVRRYELTYDNTIACIPGQCPSGPEFGPYRSLLGIKEIGDPAGTPLEQPEVKFSYGPGAGTGTAWVPARSPIYPKTFDIPAYQGQQVNWLASGTRYGDTRSSEVGQMLGDLDGDGRLDLLRSNKSGGSCVLEWHRNISGTPTASAQIDFEITPVAVALPTLSWEQGSSPTGDEACSLTGQLFNRGIQAAPQCPQAEFGSYLVYRLMDLNNDGLQDLVTAVHADRSYDPTADITNDLYAGIAPTCSPEGPYCRSVDPLCLDGAQTCQGVDPTYCEYTQTGLESCWDSGTPTDCDELESYLLPGGGPGGGGIDPCSFYARKPYLLDCGYLWTVYYNNGDPGAPNPFFDLSQPETLISPVELESYLGDGTLAVANRGLGSTSWTNHSVQDFDGDGILDAAHTSDTSGLWAIWRGTLSNGKLSFDRQNRVVWMSPAPMGDSVAEGNNQDLPPDHSINFSKLQLLDIDGNGRLDLANDGRIHWNKGDGFPLNPVDYLLPFWEFEGRLSQSTTLENDLNPDGFITNGERFACIRSLDYDQDGRLDFMDCRKSLTRAFPPRIGFGTGNGVGPLFELPALYGSPDDKHGHYQIVDAQGLPNTWELRSGFMDLDGDGLEEDINFNNIYKINGEFPGAPPIRLMNSIDNGRGLVTSISYAPHVDETVVDPGDGRLPKATWVVKSIERTDAHGAGGTTEFSYRGPMFGEDDDGKWGFRGFDEARTKSPLGALTVNRYDYSVDWSGRLVETLVFASDTDYSGDPSSSGTDEAVSISKTTWQTNTQLGCALKWPEIEVFLTASTNSYTCSNGQSIDDCIANGAHQHTDFAYTILPNAAKAQVCRVATVDRCSGPTCGAGDTRVATDYTTKIAQLDYRVRLLGKTTSEYDQGLALVTVADEANVWSNDHVTLDAIDVDLGGTLGVARTSFSYDAFGNVATKTLPDRPAQQFSYAPESFHLYPVSTTNELGHVVSQVIDLGTGNVVSTDGPGPNQHTATAYDALGRPIQTSVKVEDGIGGFVVEPVSFIEYFDSESPQRVRTSTRIDFEDTCVNASDPACAKLDERFDGHGRLLSITQLLSGTDAVTTYGYDAAGNVVSTQVPDPTDTFGSLTVTYTTEYDNLGRPRTFSTPATGFPDLVMEYDGLVVTRKKMRGPSDPTDLAELSNLTSDVFGRLVEVEEQSDYGGGWAKTVYEYDGLDNLVQVISADGVVTDIDRNLAGWRTAITRSGRTWGYGYNKNGDMTSIVAPVPTGEDGGLYTTLINYDFLGRPTSKLPGSRGLSQSEIDELGLGLITYDYDDGGEGGIGRLTHVERGSVWTKDLTYDTRGNVISDTRSFTVPGQTGDVTDTRTQSFAYNAMGAVKATTHADDVNAMLATDTSVTFDEVGRPAQLFSNRYSGSIQLSYSVAGLVYLRDGPNATGTRIISHDVLGRVTVDRVIEPASFTCASHQRFNYEAGLNRINSIDSYIFDPATGTAPTCPATPIAEAETFTFGYDKQNQITSVVGPISGPNQYQATFGYTPGGRLASANVIASPTAPLAPTRNVDYEYGDGTASDPEAVERLIDVGGGPDVAAYAYDESGSVLTRAESAGTYTFVYGGEDQQRKVTAPDGSEELYHYDESGSRILAIERNGQGIPQKIRWWFGGTEIHYDSTGLETRTLVHDGLGAPQIRVRDKTMVEDTFHDARGHLLVALDDQSVVKSGFTYGPFGEVLSAVGTPEDFVRRFNGKEFDDVSSLSYYGARYYDALSLAWTQADPRYRFAPEFAYFEPRRGNLYSFSLNNANHYRDMDGLEPGTIILYGRHKKTEKYSKNPKAYRAKLVRAVNKTYGKRGKTRVLRLTSKTDIKRVANGGKADRLIFVTHGSRKTRSILPDYEDASSPGVPVLGRTIGEAVAGSGVREVIITGCDAGRTGAAKDVAKAAPGVRVVAYTGQPALKGYVVDGRLLRLWFETKNEGQTVFEEDHENEEKANREEDEDDEPGDSDQTDYNPPTHREPPRID